MLLVFFFGVEVCMCTFFYSSKLQNVAKLVHARAYPASYEPLTALERKLLAQLGNQNTLLTGLSGVGKSSMISEAFADTTKFRVFRVRSSTVKSSLVGETENNIANIFKEAVATAANSIVPVVLFDELEKLFLTTSNKPSLTECGKQH